MFMLIASKFNNEERRYILATEEDCRAVAKLEAGEELVWQRTGYYAEMYAAHTPTLHKGFTDFLYYKQNQLA